MNLEEEKKELKKSLEKAQTIIPTQANFVLSEEERNLVELQRQEFEILKKFKTGYQKLVNETGYFMVVDANSPVGNIKVAIAKAR